VRGLWLIEQQVDGGGRQDNGAAGAGRGGWPRLVPGRAVYFWWSVGASGDVYVCERNASLLCLGPTA